MAAASSSASTTNVEEKVHTQSFSVENLSTKSVTIYPSRAAIVRDIENVVIRPGRNEITIFNLSHHIDEHSIKVEGHGTDALITDITAERYMNLADDSPNDIPSDSESEYDTEEEMSKTGSIAKASDEIKSITRQIEDLEQVQATVQQQLSFLNNYLMQTNILGKPEDSKPVNSIEDLISVYGQEREKLFRTHKDAELKTKDLRKLLEKKNRALNKLKDRFRLEHRAERKARDKRRQERLQRKSENHIERGPHLAYRVKISIESNTLPAKTRTIAAAISTGRPPHRYDDSQPPGTGSRLRISYITLGATWSPHYDLRLDTTSRTGILTYRAHFRNSTNETWRDANITLSTSQTGFSGVGDKVPWMDTWRISLRKKASYETQPDGGLFSPKEKQAITEKKSASKKGKSLQPWQDPPSSADSNGQAQPVAPAGQPRLAVAARQTANPFTLSSGSLFGSANAAAYTTAGGSGLYSNIRGRSAELPGPVLQPLHDDDVFGQSATVNPDSDSDSETNTLTPGRMRLAASTNESYGLTTTYELPGTRTVLSSNLTRRHVITEIEFLDVDFSHISVPKLRAAAFLRAKIRNTSNVELLKGNVGLTLDGSFLGNSHLPRCAPSESFEIGLGVDEAIQIAYAKPVSRFASQGMLVKEQIVTYSRSTYINNRRSSRIKILILDQIPVSEDERLKVVMLVPKGLKSEGDGVFVDARGRYNGGIAAGESGTRNSRSSIASLPPPPPGRGSGGKVMLKKGGEVFWELELEGGLEMRLPLEYEARVPGGEAILVS